MAILSVDQKMALLIEQSDFLLEKQQEALTECEGMYDELFAHIDRLISQESKPTQIKELKDIRGMLEEQAQSAFEAIGDDIDFLKAQRASLLEIKEKPAAKRAELLASVIGEDEDIDSLELFKKDVLEEAEASRTHLRAMIDDLKHALEDGDLDEIKMYLQSVDDEDEFDFDDQGEECGECTGCDTGDGCCSSADDEDEEFNDEDESFDDEDEETEDEDEETEEKEAEDECCSSSKNSQKNSPKGAASRCKCGKFDSCKCSKKCNQNKYFLKRLLQQGGLSGTLILRKDKFMPCTLRSIVKKVYITPGCISCGTCESVSPKVFKVTDVARVLDDAPIEQCQEEIKEAAELCPVSVIKYEE